MRNSQGRGSGPWSRRRRRIADVLTPQTVVDDDTDGWWSGVNFNGVRAAIAGTAAALAASTAIAGSFTQQDEIVQPVSAGGGLPYSYGVRERAQTRFQRWGQNDELPVQPSAALDDGDWVLPVPQAPKPFLAPILDDPSDAFLRIAEEENWQAPLVIPWVPNRLLPWDDPDFVQTQPTVLDDSGWLDLRAIQAAPVVTIWQTEDDFPSPTLDEEPWAAPRTYQGAPITFTLHANDETITPATIVEDEPAPPLAAYQTPPTQVVWAEDEGVAPQSSLSVEDEYWQPFKPQPPTIDLRLWAENDDVLPQPRIEDDYWARIDALPVAPFNLVWTHQDEIQTPGTFEDDSWQVYTPGWPKPSFLYLPEPEEVAASAPTPLPSDEEYWLVFAPYQWLIPSASFPVNAPVEEDFPALTAPPAVVVDTGTGSWYRHPETKFFFDAAKGADHISVERFVGKGFTPKATAKFVKLPAVVLRSAVQIDAADQATGSESITVHSVKTTRIFPAPPGLIRSGPKLIRRNGIG